MTTAGEGFVAGILATVGTILLAKEVAARKKRTAATPTRRAKTWTKDLPPRYVTDPDGERLRVRRRNGEWEYYYDREWTPLRYLGGPGHDWEIRGSRLIDR